MFTFKFGFVVFALNCSYRCCNDESQKDFEAIHFGSKSNFLYSSAVVTLVLVSCNFTHFCHFCLRFRDKNKFRFSTLLIRLYPILAKHNTAISKLSIWVIAVFLRLPCRRALFKNWTPFQFRQLITANSPDRQRSSSVHAFHNTGTVLSTLPRLSIQRFSSDVRVTFATP